MTSKTFRGMSIDFCRHKNEENNLDGTYYMDLK